MITNINRKVICVKELPSNLIEEAIFILKTDIDEHKNLKTKREKNELILKETEDFIHMYSLDLEKQKMNEKKMLQQRRWKIIIGAVAFSLICLLISIVIQF